LTRLTQRAFGMRGPLVLVLLAGRGTFRTTSQLAPLALAATWGPGRLGEYASAIGLSAWTMFIAFSGEKAALKILPRTRRISGAVVRVVLAIAAAPLMLAMLALAAGMATAVRPIAVLCLVAVLWGASIGLLQVVAGLHRLRGAPIYDAAAFLCVAGSVAVTTVLAYHFSWSPLRQLVSISVAALVVVLAILLKLPRAWLLPKRGESRRRVAGRVLRTCCLLGLPELLGSTSVAVCYLALTLTGQRADSGPFYVAIVVSGFCSATIIYLLRLGQPATSARLRGLAAATGRQQTRRVLGIAAATSALCTVALACVLAVPGIGDTGTRNGLLLCALTLVEIPLFALVSYASYLLENTDGRALSITSGAAIAGLGAVGLAVVVLVPALGAAGAMGSLVISLGAIAVAMRRGLTRRYADRGMGRGLLAAEAAPTRLFLRQGAET
jgi:hypothetical protein